MFRTARFQYRVVFTPTQEVYANALLGACRATYNAFLSNAEQEYSRQKKAEQFGLPFKHSMNDIVSKVSAFKRQPEERQWLLQYPAWTIQKAADAAKQAYQNWWHHQHYSKPRYKKKSNRFGGARFEKPKNGYKIERLNRNNSRIWLSKIGWVKFRDSRPDLPLNATGATLVREASGKYYISFVVQQQIAPPKTYGTTISADLGLEDLLVWTRTDGTRGKISAARHYRAAERKLQRLQKEYSRKEAGSKNQAKALKKLALAHEKVRFIRQDEYRKIASSMASENQAVILETLSAAGMKKNRYLAKSASDAAFGLLVDAIRNACQRHGTTVEQLDKFQPTTKVCSQCGVIRDTVPLHVRTWQCEHCFAVVDRDFNAAVNIYLAGGTTESINACGENVRGLALVNSSLNEARTQQETTAKQLQWFD